MTSYGEIYTKEMAELEQEFEIEKLEDLPTIELEDWRSHPEFLFYHAAKEMGDETNSGEYDAGSTKKGGVKLLYVRVGSLYTYIIQIKDKKGVRLIANSFNSLSYPKRIIRDYREREGR